MRRAVVGVLTCQKQRPNGTTYSRVNDLVVDQLVQYANVAVLTIPAVHGELTTAVLTALDGIVLPGSGSYVHPDRFGRPAEPEQDREYDAGRDCVAMALLSAADRMPGLPVLGSCRGMQEIAVHYGARLRDVDGAGMHRRPAGPDRWGPAHPVTLTAGGLLTDLAGDPDERFMVNSQHSQVVDQPSGTMRVEAVAPDGAIEAISVGWPGRFVVGIQWHFEHHTDLSPLDLALLAEFGHRCAARQNAQTTRASC